MLTDRTEVNFVQCLNIVCSSKSSVLIENGGIRPLRQHLHHHRARKHANHNYFRSVSSYRTAEAKLSCSVNCWVFLSSQNRTKQKKLPSSTGVKVSQWSIIGHCSCTFSTGVWVLVLVPRFWAQSPIKQLVFLLRNTTSPQGYCVSVWNYWNN